MATQQPLLLSASIAAELIGISKRTLHNFRKREDFPKPIVLGPKAVRWRRQEIEAWIADLSTEAQTRPEPLQLSRVRLAHKWPPPMKA